MINGVRVADGNSVPGTTITPVTTQILFVVAIKFVVDAVPINKPADQVSGVAWNAEPAPKQKNRRNPMPLSFSQVPDTSPRMVMVLYSQVLAAVITTFLT